MSNTIWFKTDEVVPVTFNLNDEDGDAYIPNSKPVVRVIVVHGSGDTEQTYGVSANSCTAGPAGLFYQLVTVSAGLKCSAGAFGIIHVSASVSGGATPGGVYGVLKLAADRAGEYVPSDLSAIASAITLISAVKTSVSAIHTVTSAILTDTGTTLDGKLDDIQGATFNTATDSLEAIRDQGDNFWTGSPPALTAGTAQTGASTTITLETSATAVDDFYKGALVRITSGKGANQAPRVITGYTGSTRLASCYPAWASAPDNTSVYTVDPDQVDVLDIPSTADIVAAVWDTSTVGHTNAGTFGQQVKSDVDSILTKVTTVETNVGDAVTSATLFSAIANIDAVGSASASALMRLVLTNYDVATSADVSAIVSARVAAEIASYAPLKSADASAIMQSAAFQAVTNFDPVTSADLVGAEPSTAGSSTSDLRYKVDVLHALAVNKVTQTSTVFTLRNSADGADIATGSVSDDGTTFTRGKLT